MSEAKALAEKAARQLAERFARTGQWPQHQYGYLDDRPVREPVLREIKNDSGQLAAVVTRNGYGATVLNCARAMFLDVDLPEDSQKQSGFVARLFGKAVPPVRPAHTEQKVKDQIHNWNSQNSGWGWRLYRTRAGFRLLATHALFDPEVAAANGVFTAFAVDPLYRQLCQTQKCFRARLTPKPWRCHVWPPRNRWPFENAAAEQRFTKWQRRYNEASEAWATCEFLGSFGNEEVHPEIRPIIATHDETTRAFSKLALA